MLGQKVKKQAMKQGIGIPAVLDGSPSFGREGEQAGAGVVPSSGLAKSESRVEV